MFTWKIYNQYVYSWATNNLWASKLIMKIFEIVLKGLESNGFKESEARFNKHQLQIHMNAALNISLVCVQLLHVANTLKEYMDGIFILCVAILIFISRASTAFKTKTIFMFINRLEGIINDSNCPQLSSISTQKINKINIFKQTF